jgi:hypothetical protein
MAGLQSSKIVIQKQLFLNVRHIQGQVAAGQILKVQQTNKHALILCPLWS